MPEFLELTPPGQALETFLDNLPLRQRVEMVQTENAAGRVTAEDVTAPHALPEFKRSTVDGYAVKARDTHGASDALPAYLNLKGEVPMGGSPSFQLSETECALIHTGGMLPEGADAVVMVEFTQQSQPDQIEIFHAAAEGENVIEKGEDITEGELVIPEGKRLRAADIGGLLALGITEISVSKKPVVGIISSGDEVIPPDQQPSPGQVRDINSYTLSTLVHDAGGRAVQYGIVEDTRDAMFKAVAEAKENCHVVIVTAGSSASTRDLTAEIMDAQGEPGVLIHGVNVKPGKPTILAVADETSFIGLPGNPVSALVIAGLFVKPVIAAYLGQEKSRIPPTTPARLAVNVSSQTGREHYLPVRLEPGEEGYQAHPVFGKSNLIFILVRADGLVKIPSEASGMSAGEEVTVTLF